MGNSLHSGKKSLGNKRCIGGSFIPSEETTPKNLEEKVATEVTKIARTTLIDIQLSYKICDSPTYKTAK